MGGAQGFVEMDFLDYSIGLLQDPPYRRDPSSDSFYIPHLSQAKARQKFYSRTSVPRTLVLLRHAIPATPLLVSGDAIVILIPKSKLCLVSIYIDPLLSCSETETFVRYVFELAPAGFRSIIGGDFNAHHPAWGSNRPDARGRIILGLVEEFGYSPANSGAATYHSRTWKSLSHIDLTILHPGLLYTSWSTVCSSTSDHEIIRCEIEADLLPTCNQIRKVCPSQFCDFLMEVDDLAHDDPERACDSLMDLICRASDQASSLVPRQGPSTPNHIRLLLRKARRLKHRWRRCPSVENRITLDSTLAELHKEASSTPISLKTARAFMKRELVAPSPNSEDPNPSDFFEMSGLPADSDAPAAPRYCRQGIPTDVPDLLESEVLDALFRKSRKRTAACPFDGVSFGLLHLATSRSPSFLRLIWSTFNLCWRRSVFPKRLKHSFLMFIPKAGGQGWRPISLLPCLGKVFEDVIRVRLLKATSFPDFQFGFIPDRSTELCLLTRVEHVRRNPGLWSWLDMDLKNAFNHATLDAFLVGWDHLDPKPPEHLRQICVSYLRGRRVSTSSCSFWVLNSVPQGGILSPLLFNVTLLAPLQELRCLLLNREVSAYADDSTVLTPGTSASDLLLRTAETIATTVEVFRKYNFPVSPTKSKVMLINYPGRLPPSIGDIPVVTSLCSLGVIVDQNLNFREHAELARFRAASRLARLAQFVRRTPGIPFTRLLYTQVVRPILLYCSTLWAQHSSVVEKIAHKAARLVLGSLKTASTLVCIRASGIRPVARDMAEKSCIRLLHSNSLHERFTLSMNSPLTGLRHLKTILTRASPILEFFQRGHPLIPKKIQRRTHMTGPGTGPGIYCDGSHGRSKWNTGCGAVALANGKIVTRGARISSPLFQDALSAEVAGLLLARDLKISFPELSVFCDCLPAMDIALHLKWFSSDELLWVKSGSCEGNRIADRIAKDFARSNLPGPPLLLPIHPRISEAFFKTLNDYEARISWNSSVGKLGNTIRSLIGPFEVLEKLGPFLSRVSFRLLQGHNLFRDTTGCVGTRIPTSAIYAGNRGPAAPISCSNAGTQGYSEPAYSDRDYPTQGISGPWPSQTHPGLSRTFYTSPASRGRRSCLPIKIPVAPNKVGRTVPEQDHFYSDYTCPPKYLRPPNWRDDEVKHSI